MVKPDYFRKLRRSAWVAGMGILISAAALITRAPQAQEAQYDLLIINGHIIEISEKAGLPGHILHLKIDGKPNWGEMAEQVKEIQAARDRGVEITANQYPYIAAMTHLETCLPPKFRAGSDAEIAERLKDPKARAEIRAFQSRDGR